jgi:hypothetical protein
MLLAERGGLSGSGQASKQAVRPGNYCKVLSRCRVNALKLLRAVKTTSFYVKAPNDEISIQTGRISPFRFDSSVGFMGCRSLIYVPFLCWEKAYQCENGHYRTVETVTIYHKYKEESFLWIR